MSWAIVWAPRAEKDREALDAVTARRVLRSVERFAASGHGDVKRLAGLPGEYRLRVGDWRVRFTLDMGLRLMTVLRVLPRGSAYRG